MLLLLHAAAVAAAVAAAAPAAPYDRNCLKIEAALKPTDWQQLLDATQLAGLELVWAWLGTWCDPPARNPRSRLF